MSGFATTMSHHSANSISPVNSMEASSGDDSRLSISPALLAKLPPPPTDAQIQLVRNSWAQIKDNLQIGDQVYKHLFQRSPTAQQLFRRFNPQSQSRAFMVMLGFSVNGLANVNAMIPSLIKLGRRHVVYKCTDNDYRAMQSAVMEVIAGVFRDQWRGALENAWNDVFTFLSGVMQSTDQQVAAEIQQQQFQKHMENRGVTAAGISPVNSGAQPDKLADFEGFLEKLSSSKSTFFKRATFSKRWVELRDGQILCFRKRTQAPVAIIPLTKTSKLQEYDAKPYSFQVVIENEPHIFMAGGDIEKDMWWEAIQKAIRRLIKGDENTVLLPGEAIPQLALADFDLLKVVGKGSYGKVYKARQKDTGEIFAIKSLKKDSLMNLSKYQDLELSAERKILQKIRHPFVVQLQHAFFSDTKLFLVMDFLQGGVLLWHMNHRRQQPSKGLADADVQFYSAEVVLALQHLHSFGIIYRDLKPENLMLDKHGHVVLTDFGLATTKGQGIMMCGSAPFMAPEIVKRQPYSQAVDWWSLGVLMYEMMCGARLFSGRGDEVFAKILTLPIRFPSWFRPEVSDLLRGMLTREPAMRITGEDIVQHAWFHGINFELLEKRQVPPPFIPDISGSDMKYFEACSQEDSMAVQSNPAKPQPSDSSPVMKQLLEEFPHNSRVMVLSQEEFGQPIIAPDGTIRRPSEVMDPNGSPQQQQGVDQASSSMGKMNLNSSGGSRQSGSRTSYSDTQLPSPTKDGRSNSARSGGILPPLNPNSPTTAAGTNSPPASASGGSFSPNASSVRSPGLQPINGGNSSSVGVKSPPLGAVRPTSPRDLANVNPVRHHNLSPLK